MTTIRPANGRRTVTWVGVALTAALLLGLMISAWVSVQSTLADTYRKDGVQALLQPIRNDLNRIRTHTGRIDAKLDILLERSKAR
jgi:hypothetical protein